ncbi:unnamed protein product [Mytilus edulis]|uniref:TIR domain-containing protein n=1 Tax=Mytilus edulis TaxID=6550 RepID=A0A8S3TIX5_MYTED|nr:unnamed protein product [Mytilus edulis]
MDTFRNVSNNNLTSLVFTNNSIEDLTADAFQELNDLRHLEISHERKLNISTLKICNANIRNLVYLLRVNAWKRKGYAIFNSSESCEYDAFVIYCDSDRQWVHYDLLNRLEEIGLKVCVHQRDFDIGESIIDNIAKYVGKSWKIIVVMSNNFTKSEWCQWEVDFVQERRRRHGKEALILIMHSQIDSSHMTTSIRSLLDTTPHLQYQKGLGEDLFWSAIMKAVKKPLKHPPVSVL